MQRLTPHMVAETRSKALFAETTVEADKQHQQDELKRAKIDDSAQCEFGKLAARDCFAHPDYSDYLDIVELLQTSLDTDLRGFHVDKDCFIDSRHANGVIIHHRLDEMSLELERHLTCGAAAPQVRRGTYGRVRGGEQSGCLCDG